MPTLACKFSNKEALEQVLSREFWEISKNNFFTKHLWAAASEEHLQTAASAFLETGKNILHIHCFILWNKNKMLLKSVKIEQKCFLS